MLLEKTGIRREQGIFISEDKLLDCIFFYILLNTVQPGIEALRPLDLQLMNVALHKHTPRLNHW